MLENTNAPYYLFSTFMNTKSYKRRDQMSQSQMEHKKKRVINVTSDVLRQF